MTTTAEHLAARKDEDLIQRLIAAAEQAGVSDADTWVRENIGALITAPVSGEDTISSVHAYANNVYLTAVKNLPPRPGLDPAAIVDSYLAAAVAEVIA